MSRVIFSLAMVGLLIFSQSGFAQTETAASLDKPQAGKQTPETPQTDEQTKTNALTPVPIENGIVVLAPENTKVEFVGTHVGDKPDPRLGGFSKFKGQLKTAEDGKSISAVSVEFETASVWTTIPNLTTHLKNSDFFDVEKHPTAKFESTKVVPGDKPGTVNVTGNFSLLGETKEISFPAEFKIDGSGLLLQSKFKIDRTLFGMNEKVDRVSPEVSLTVSVGEKTKSSEGGQNARQGRRSGRDPAQFFARMDADGDGKIAGEEIPERMKDRLEQIDTDGDGAISLEEMQEMMKRFRSGGNRRDGGGQ